MRSSPNTTEVLDCSPVSRRGAMEAPASRGKRSVRTKRTEPPREVARIDSRSKPSRSSRQNPGLSNASAARTRPPSRSTVSESPPVGARAASSRIRGTAYVSSGPSAKVTSTRTSQADLPSSPQSRTRAPVIVRPFAPNQRWRGRAAGSSATTARSSAAVIRAGSPGRARSDGCPLDSKRLVAVAGPLQAEPVEAVRAQAQEVGRGADGRERRAAEHLDRRGPGEGAQVELDRLRRRREVGDDQERLAGVPAQVGEHLRVARPQELDAPPPEHRRRAP